MQSDSSSSSSSARNRKVSSSQKRKRRRVLLEFSDDEDDSGDEVLFGKKQPPNRTPRITLSNQHKPSSHRSLKMSDKQDDDSESVSTSELVRRIKDNTPQHQLEKKQPPTDEGEVNSAMKDNKTVDSTLMNPELQSLSASDSPSLKNDAADSEEESDDGLSHLKDNDDESSVSTKELIRRIRGEAPEAISKPHAVNESCAKNGMPATVEPPKENRKNQSNATPPTQTEIVADPGDFYLPSPLPSDDSSDEDEEDDSELEVLSNPEGAFLLTKGAAAQGAKSQLTGQPTGTSREEDEDERDADQPDLTQHQPIVREGLRKSIGPFARQRLLNATGAFQNPSRASIGWTSSGRESSRNVEYVEDIDNFSDDERGNFSRIEVRRESRAQGLSERNIRNISDPSFAANVVGGFQRPFPVSATAQKTFRSAHTNIPPLRNDLNGGSGVGAGQYQMVAEPPEPAQRPARGGRGGKRSYTRRTGGKGRGRGRRRGKSKGRGRGGGGAGRESSRGSNYASESNAWSDYASQSAPWASSSQPSNLGNVGGAEISF